MDREEGRHMRNVFCRSLTMLTCCLLLSAVTSAAVPVQASPTLPTWVKPGLVLRYAEDLGGYVDYDYTDTVTSVSQGVAHLTTYTWSPGLPDTGKYVYWHCSSVCTGVPAQTASQFWIDPGNPVSSLSGGHWRYRYLGVKNVKVGATWWKAGVLFYSNALGQNVVTYFQSSTGLFLYHREYAYSLAAHSWYAIIVSYQGTGG
jgi:hypothetical protein